MWILYSQLEESLGNLIRSRSILERARFKNPANPRIWLESVRLELRGAQPAIAQTLMARGTCRLAHYAATRQQFCSKCKLVVTLSSLCFACLNLYLSLHSDAGLPGLGAAVGGGDLHGGASPAQDEERRRAQALRARPARAAGRIQVRNGSKFIF